MQRAGMLAREGGNDPCCFGSERTPADQDAGRVARRLAPHPGRTALDGELWIPRTEQEALVALLQASLARSTCSVRAFHLGQGAELGAWFESLAGDPLADALELERADSGGFYAQFLCSEAAGLPRAAVLSEYLLDRLGQRSTPAQGSGAAPAAR